MCISAGAGDLGFCTFWKRRALGCAALWMLAGVLAPSVHAGQPPIAAVGSICLGSSTPGALVLGDFNEDGINDVVVAADGLFLSAGRPDGTFGDLTSVTGLGGLVSIVQGDFNRDGHLDVATFSRGYSVLAVFLGVGDGTFVRAADVATGLDYQSTFTAADTNGDGLVDLVVQSSVNRSGRVYRGNGDGTFSSASTFDAPYAATSVVACDVNRDGIIDLIATNSSAPTLSVSLGVGDGTFASRVEYGTGSIDYAVAGVDLNSDGGVDLVVANQNGIAVLLGYGDGTFAQYQDVLVRGGIATVLAGDFDGDGHADVVGIWSDASASVLLGDGAGGLAVRGTYDLGAGISPVAASAGQINRDQYLDMVCLCVFPTYGTRSQPAVCLMYGDGRGGFATRTDVPTLAAGSPRTESVASGDFDADGMLDLVTANYSAGTISVLFGTGQGSFSARLQLSEGRQPIDVAVADLNRDGHDDIVCLDSYVSAVWPNFTVFLGNGDGTFRPRLDFLVPGYPMCLNIADVNNDGLPDVLVGLHTPSGIAEVLVFRNYSGTSFLSPITCVGSYGNAHIVLTADLTGDGIPDLVFDANGKLEVMQGIGDGTFGPPTEYPLLTDALGGVVADLNGDGRNDVLVCGSSCYSMFPNVGGGLLGQRIDGTLVGRSVGKAALGDIDGDAIPDLVTANTGGATVTVVHGTPTGPFGPAFDYRTGPSPSDVSLVDVNRDGTLDLIVSNGQAASVSVLLNQSRRAPVVTAPTIVSVLEGSALSITVTAIDPDGDPIDSLTADLSQFPAGNNALFVSDGDHSGGVLNWTPGFSDSGLYVVTFTAKNQLVGAAQTRIRVENLDSRPVLEPIASQFVMEDSSVDVPVRATDPDQDMLHLEIHGPTFASLTSLSYSPGHASGVLHIAPGFDLAGTYPCTINAQSGGLIDSTTFPIAVRSATGPPHIAGVKDVPLDQGGRVQVSWYPSPFDRHPNDLVATYRVWRSIPTDAPLATDLRGSSTASRAMSQEARIVVRRTAGVDSFWEYVAELPASGLTGYSRIVDTPYDSTASGNLRTKFFIQALSADGVYHFNSPVDSGYSVDNLSPAAPLAFAGSYNAWVTRLHWAPNLEKDLAGYRLYRSPILDFTPGPGNLAGATTDTCFADPGMPGSYYKLSAVDLHGNESPFALLTPANTAGVGFGDVPRVLALAAPAPNPLRDAAALRVSLPQEGRIELAVFDCQGRRVRELLRGVMPAGERSVAWDGKDDLGRTVSSGIYFVNLETTGKSLTRRVAVVR